MLDFDSQFIKKSKEHEKSGFFARELNGFKYLKKKSISNVRTEQIKVNESEKTFGPHHKQKTR